MAINVSFNGATIYKPGAYSKLNIDLGGGFPLGPTGLIAIFGESTRGTPGASEPSISKNVYTASQIADVRAKYGSGSIVDAMNFLFAPASDGAIPSGAQAVYIYKTNAAVRATLALATAYGTVRSREWGTGGNNVTWTATQTAEVAPTRVSSAAFNGSAMGASTFTASLNGGAAVTMSVAATYADLAALQSAAAGWTAALTGVTFTVTGSAITAAILTITVDADAAANRKGYGKSLELVNATSTPLAAMNITTGMVVSTIEPAMSVVVKQTRDLLTESATVGGNVVFTAGYDGAGATATVQVTATDVILTANAITNTYSKAAYPTLLQLVTAMNLVSGWKVALSSNLYNSVSPSVLDVVNVGAKSANATTSKPARIKKDANEVAAFFAASITAEIVSQSVTGLMDAVIETVLAGGALGATTTASVTAALSAFEELRVNSVVPLFSRDAVGSDITDQLTDAASTYTIDGIMQSVKTHLSLMSTTKNRSERQGYVSYKKSFTACLDQASLLADSRMQMAIQDTRNVDSQGVIKWFQPWAMSCLMAGARGGCPVGTPLTFKFFNCSGIRHTAQSMSVPDVDIVMDFNPNKQYDQAIQGGISFMEAPQSGGIRLVVDNTTYQKDANWVLNRGNVRYAADILSFDFRTQLENIYVGVKNTVKASEVKSVAASILNTYLAQGITVSTPTSPNGYKNLTVSIVGNQINIGVTATLVEGIDFVLNDITVSRASSAA